MISYLIRSLVSTMSSLLTPSCINMIKTEPLRTKNNIKTLSILFSVINGAMGKKRAFPTHMYYTLRPNEPLIQVSHFS